MMGFLKKLAICAVVFPFGMTALVVFMFWPALIWGFDVGWRQYAWLFLLGSVFAAWVWHEESKQQK